MKGKILSLAIILLFIVGSFGAVGNQLEKEEVKYENLEQGDWINLKFIPGSVELFSRLDIINTRNWIRFEFENEGTVDVNDLYILFTIEFEDELNKEPIVTDYIGYYRNLKAGIYTDYQRTLFRITLPEFMDALINYAGIKHVNITIDPENKYPEDLNKEDNTYYFKTEYYNIFPKFGHLESLFLKFF